MKTLVSLSAAALALGLAAGAFAQAPAPAAPTAAAPAKPKYSVASTPLVDLIRDPKAKPILAKNLSGIWDQVEANADMIPPEFTLQMLADYAQGMITADNLKAIDVELGKL